VLTRAGYSVAAARVPPYCGLQQAAADRRWLPSGTAGCPVSRADAEAAAPGTRALEAVLARVSSTTSSPVGRDRLAWLVVTRASPIAAPLVAFCGPATAMRCVPRPVATVTAVVFVDAHTGQPLEVLPIGMPPIGRMVPVPAIVQPAIGAVVRPGG